MSSESVKLARLENQRVAIDKGLSLLAHPIYSVVAAFILIEYLQKLQVNGQPLVGEVMGTALETAFIAQGTLVALSKSGTLDSLSSLLPLLIAK